VTISRFGTNLVLFRTLGFVSVAAAVALTAACGGGAPSTPPGSGSALDAGATQSATEARGSVVSVVPVADLEPAEVSAGLRAAGVEGVRARYGVTAYRVVYRTVGVAGDPTTASQLVALPTNDQSDLRVVLWLHGTTVYRGDVASMKADSTDRAVGLLLASAGGAVSAPDYIGLGEGPGTHPYGDPGATVSASLGALRAARDVARQEGRTFDERVQISGFSQGGPATMMVGRALQEGADPDFSLGGLTTISGPFDLSGFEAAAANDEIENASLYLSYFTIAWDRMYGLYDEPQEIFREPYARQMEILFDGDHRSQEIAAALSPKSADLFTEEFLDTVRNPTGELQQRLHVLDTTCDWRPDVPVRIYHASGDRDVAFENARHCQQQLAARGAEQQLIDVGAVDHNGTLREVLPQLSQELGLVE